VIDLAAQVKLQLTVNLAAESQPTGPPAHDLKANDLAAGANTLAEAFPLLRPLPPQSGRAVNRFSVTQLLNFERCPRQYYFDRVMHAPTAEAVATWNNAEAPEPPANLTATLKGAVIHRFCEAFRSGDDAKHRLLQSFQDVTAARQAELADRWLEIETDKVLEDLLPLAENYLASPVFQRVQAAQRLSLSPHALPGNEEGLWSELSFRLRRPLGILAGTIDKLLVRKSVAGTGFEIEIIDFKTNRLRVKGTPQVLVATPEQKEKRASGHREKSGALGQIAFDFLAPAAPGKVKALDEGIDAVIQRAASEYQLQMQAYALAVRELMPQSRARQHRITVTLHFLDPNVEVHLQEDLLEPESCVEAIDAAMLAIVAAREPEHFPVQPATHCRMCNFLDLCSAGRKFLRTS